MTWTRPAARRLIGAGLLLPGLLLSPPMAAAAASIETASSTRLAKDAGTRPEPPRAQKLAAKTTGSVSPARPAAPRSQSLKKGKVGPSAVKRGAEERCVHVVRRGDTVGRVAARYRVGPQSIIARNRLGPAGTLKVGQRIALPGCEGGGRRGEPVSPAPAVELETGLLLARVGPNRIPTRLFVDVPDFGAEAIEFTWPVEGMVASGFGKRRMGWHAGIDIKADVGTPVLAAAAGTVSFSGWSASYGRLVKVQHPNGFVTVYAHNNENLVEVGDTVEAGTMIATVGRTGRATDHHLHFEIRRDGMAFNPLFLLEGRDDTPVLVSAPAEPLEAGEPLGEEIDEDVGE